MAAETSTPPRLMPDRPFPAYAYRPGRTPHPTRGPDGHSHGAVFPDPEPPDPDNWRASGDYLYGIDLFNHGFFWEAHEAWEGLWVACGRDGPTATFLQALINLAAAGFKARLGNAGGTAANAGTALRLLRSFEAGSQRRGGRFMGLDVGVLGDRAAALSQSRPGRAPVFDLVLRPD